MAHKRQRVASLSADEIKDYELLSLRGLGDIKIFKTEEEEIGRKINDRSDEENLSNSYILDKHQPEE